MRLVVYQAAVQAQVLAVLVVEMLVVHIQEVLPVVVPVAH
jgi:hypothetical protein